MSDELDFDNLNFGMGWHNDPEAVQEVVRQDSILGVSSYIGSQAGERPEKTDLSVYLRKLYGDDCFLRQLSCGSCVSFGYALAVDILIAIQVVDDGAAKPEGRTAAEPIYFGSRNDIGGGRIGGQGSVGAWAAKWLKDYGAASRHKYPSMDLTTYDPSFCFSGQSRRPVPEDIKAEAKQHTVKTYAQVSSFEEAAAAIESGYPVPVCSNQGFSKQRDAQGFSKPQGSWGHCLCCIGVRHDRPGVLIANSWGNFYTGGPADLSGAVKWVDAKVFDRMASQGDTFSIADVSGFPKKSLNFGRLNW